MKLVRSRTRTLLTEEHLEGCIRIETTEIKPYIERLLEAKAVLYISVMTDFIIIISNFKVWANWFVPPPGFF
jgi:hypothetical protein